MKRYGNNQKIIKNFFIEGNSMEEIRKKLSTGLSYELIVFGGKSSYCMTGGGIRNSLFDELRNFIN